jgi:phosphomannomutase
LPLGVAATPMLYFAVYHLDTDAGIQITGSHNPPDYNGFKMMMGKKSFFGEEIQKLGAIAAKGEGIHHVAAATPNFYETVAQAERENKVILSCKHSGIDIAYLDTLRDLGVIIEIASGMPGDGELPDANRTP